MSGDEPITITIDARGMRCPWPALRLAKAMKQANAVRLLADDPKAPGEVAALSQSQGWELIETSEGFLIRQSSDVTIR